MNPSTAMATVLLDELVSAGVRHVVLCPGSRSAPLAYAAQAAERAGRLTLHVRVDERSAGFLALGLAKLSRVPAVVITTSGTAVANLHPAVLEAHHGIVPLIVLSADRPVELRGTGANQTTVQPGMFADAVRWSVDAAAPQRRVGEVARWRALADDAVRSSLGEGRPDAEPGPVHVNLQLREPLVPTDGDEPWLEPLDAPDQAGGLAHASDPHRANARDDDNNPDDTSDNDPDDASDNNIDRDTAALEGIARTVVVVGDLPEPDQFERAVRWASSRGWPVVAEPFGVHPREGVLPHGPLVLADPHWLDEHAPDRVIAVGRLTLSRPVTALLRRPGVRVEAVGVHGWIESRPDIAMVHPVAVLDAAVPPGTPEAGPATARAATPEAGPATARATSSALPSPDDDRAWSLAWRSAGERVASALAGDTVTARPWPSGLAVAEAVLAALPAGATLFVGSSNSARDLDLSGPRTDVLRVVASRGLAGIDGCVSTAVGLALSEAGPTYALMGDLTFLHDSNGLLIGPLERRPDLTIVVTNDDGGGIFTLLEPGEPERADDFERIFATPTGVDLSAVCAAHHVAHQQISTREELAATLAEHPVGLRVLEVPMPRSGHRGQHASLRRAAADALRGGDEAAYRGR